MSLLPLSILSYISFVLASPSNFNETIASTVDTSSCPSCSSYRSLSDIIWSCFATLFACTWTAIHTNIPGVEEGRATIIFRRLFIMGMALIAPELMITWAAQQFFSARAVAQGTLMHKEFNVMEQGTTMSRTVTPQSVGRNSNIPGVPFAPMCKFRQWTITHGFFACMGGFLLYSNDEPVAPLAPKELLRFVDDGSVDMPILTEANIEDWSRGDMLSKAIAILQLVWFVIQLVARYIQGLPITLLEIDTLAVAALTCIAYGWWWYKPKDVGHPYQVHWKADTPAPTDLCYRKPEAAHVSGGCLGYFLYPFYSLMGWAIVSPSSARARRVPSLGGYIETGNYGTTLLIGSFSGMLFAGVHYVGWNFSFHTHPEQILWRVSSFTILGASVTISISIGYQAVQRNWKSLPVLRTFLETIIKISYFAYIAARLTLIVLVMMSFRSLPPGVYTTVNWTKFIPHI